MNEVFLTEAFEGQSVYVPKYLANLEVFVQAHSVEDSSDGVQCLYYGKGYIPSGPGTVAEVDDDGSMRVIGVDGKTGWVYIHHCHSLC